jgi:lipopolysaccharide transport system ATP-binding protein
MRLAFAVASHLEPEILIVDEVLAVGDLWFQQKCLKKMEEENKKGRTVLIVSHDMDTIQSLADGVVLLDGGKTTGLKTIDKAIQQYMYKSEQKSPGYFKAPAQDGSVSEAYILEAKVLNERNVIQTKFHTFEPIFIEITWKNKKGVPVNPNFMLVNQIGMRVMIAADVPIDWDGTKKKKIGTYISRVKIPPNMLNSNEYFIHLSLDRSRPYKKNYHNCPDALTFTVRDSMDERNIARGAFMHVRKDVALWMALDWEWKKIA